VAFYEPENDNLSHGWKNQGTDSIQDQDQQIIALFCLSILELSKETLREYAPRIQSVKQIPEQKTRLESFKSFSRD